MECQEITIDCSEEEKSEAVSLFGAYIQKVDREYSQEHIQSAFSNSMKPESRSHFFLLKDKEKTLGFCFFNVNSGIHAGGDYVWLNDIYIKEEYHGQGYGKYLLNFVENWTRENDCDYIAAVVDQENEQSKGMFNKLNFKDADYIWYDKYIK